MSQNQFTIYHNPSCSKSRETMNILVENEVVPEVVEYLESPPDKQTLQQLVARGIPIQDLIRTGEPEFKQSGQQLESMSEEDIISMIMKHPSLLQRPIVVLGDKAIIGRPPEKVLELILPS